MSGVWVASHKAETEYGVQIGGYTGLRKIEVNIQTDHSELDLQEYGEAVNEIVHLRSRTRPDVKLGDMVYLSQPEATGTFEIGGVTYDDYGDGDYMVKAIRSAYQSNTTRNPTIINARIVTK